MDEKKLWETEILCSSCGGTHLLCSEIIPRVFEYECPVTRARVSVPFRDPSRMPQPWAEVDSPSPDGIRTLVAEVHGRFEV